MDPATVKIVLQARAALLGAAGGGQLTRRRGRSRSIELGRSGLFRKCCLLSASRTGGHIVSPNYSAPGPTRRDALTVYQQDLGSGPGLAGCNGDE